MDAIILAIVALAVIALFANAAASLGTDSRDGFGTDDLAFRA